MSLKKGQKIKLLNMAIGLAVNHPKWSTNPNKAVKLKYRWLVKLLKNL